MTHSTGRGPPKHWVSFAVLVGILLAATVGHAQTLETVNVQLKWRHQFQFAGYYAAIKEGYYRDAGLEVRLIEPAEDLDPVAEVVSGRADYGIGTSELLLARGRGEPVVALAAIFQHSPLILLSRDEVAGGSVHDLIGQRVMLEQQAAELVSYLKRENVSLGDIEIIPHTVGLSGVLDGSVKALSAYSTDEPYVLEKSGLKFSTFSPRSAGIDFYGDTLFTSDHEIRSRPDRIQAMLEATRKGWLYAFNNVEELVDHILDTYGHRHSRDHLLFEAARMRSLVLPDIVEIGYMHPGRWRHIAEVYAEVGMLPENFDLSGFVYQPAEESRSPWIEMGAIGALLLSLVIGIVAMRFRNLNNALSAEVQARDEARREAETANNAKSEFLANVSHELRSPLNAILGFSELIERALVGPLPDRYREYAGDIRSAGLHLLTVINDLLDLSKIEAGHMELSRECLNLTAIAETSVKLIESTASARGVKLLLECQGSAVVHGDAVRLRQIVLNLLSNAVKFTPAGGTVTITVSPPEGQTAVLSVADTGVGMTEAETEIALQPFGQIANAISRGDEGSGLGLPLAIRLIHMHEGTLEIDSRPGEGTVMRITLPQAATEVEASHAA